MTTPNNLTQPQSLVKYGNAVMVSTSGKKTIKESKMPQNLSPGYTEDILNSILPPREYTMDKQQLWYASHHVGFSPYLPLQPPNRTSWIFRKSWIRGCSRDRQEKLEYAPFENNSILSVSTS